MSLRFGGLDIVVTGLSYKISDKLCCSQFIFPHLRSARSGIFSAINRESGDTGVLLLSYIFYLVISIGMTSYVPLFRYLRDWEFFKQNTMIFFRGIMPVRCLIHVALPPNLPGLNIPFRMIRSQLWESLFETSKD